MTKTQNPECKRCKGKGTLARYSHNNGGLCYNCGGTGHLSDSAVAYAKLAEEARLREEREVWGR